MLYEESKRPHDDNVNLAIDMIFDLLDAINSGSEEPFLDQELEDEFVGTCIAKLADIIAIQLNFMDDEDIQNICFHRECFLENYEMENKQNDAK